MLKRLVLIAILALAAVRAEALEYTDVYYNPAEPGWGVFVVQSDTFQFLALFIYGADGKPTWYTGQLTDDGTGKYNGSLYGSTGTYFALPWQGVNGPTPVGTISFQPADSYHATLIYTVNGIGKVTKTVQRQTLTAYVLSGDYSGAMSGSITGCTDPKANDPEFRGKFDLTVTQAADVSATLTFNFVDTLHFGADCKVSGLLTHFGRLYQIPNATAGCSIINGGTFLLPVNSLHATGQGIEGQWAGPAGGSCSVSFHFSAVRNVNN